MTAERLDLLGLIREKRAEMAELEGQEAELLEVVEAMYGKCADIVSIVNPQKSVNLAGEDEKPIIFYISYDHRFVGQKAPIRLKLDDLPQSLTVTLYSGKMSFWRDERHQGYERKAALNEAKGL